MSKISMIVAVSDNMAIGCKGGMPWHISADFKYFKNTTFGHAVIMGRATWESIGCRPLPGRRNIVVSRSRTEGPMEGVQAEYALSLEKALSIVAGEDEVFIIGGGQLYRQAMDFADRLYITEVHTVVEDADTFFPAVDSALWQLVSRSAVQEDEKNGLKFEFTVYERK